MLKVDCVQIFVFLFRLFHKDMPKLNYQKELEKILENISSKGKVPTLFLHCCCAPCSSYVLEYLSDYFEITVYYYNPNIFPESEYQKRMNELKRFIGVLPVKNPVHFEECEYHSFEFYSKVKGMENEPEGGSRCFVCYELRLEQTARKAAELGFDYFTTTLSISPLKNAQKLNEIGMRMAEKYKTAYLPSDFKKKEGFKRSIVLSAQYDLYRQNYCGCVFSKKTDS